MTEPISNTEPQFELIPDGKYRVIVRSLLPGGHEAILHCFDAEEAERLSKLGYEMAKAEAEANKHKKRKVTFYKILVAIKNFLMS